MNRYIVRVQSAGGYGDNVYIVKARNDKELETFMNRFLKDNLDSINGYDYDIIRRVSRRFQKKYDCPSYILCGSWVGAGYIKELLNIKKEQIYGR